MTATTRWNPIRRPLDAPLKSLSFWLVCWKAGLLLAAFLSPGPGYDTSGLIVLKAHESAEASHFASLNSPLLSQVTLTERLASKLVRWDAIYFATIARRGYVFEQEWAFGWGYTRLVSLLTRYVSGSDAGPLPYVWTAAGLSILSHSLSVLVLHRLVVCVLSEPHNSKVAFVAAFLHIVSPAGIFLCAPYAESLFSLFNFSGCLVYAHFLSLRFRNGRYGLDQDALILAAGLLFGLATTARSNGLFSALIFAYDMILELLSLSSSQISVGGLRRLACLGLGAILTAAGMIYPQWLAYTEYCQSSNSMGLPRPWCARIPPSIYGWVQDHYWNVGLFRYWTVSNIPLFLIAAPVLLILIYSSLHILLSREHDQPTVSKPRKAKPKKAQSQPSKDALRLACLRRFAIPQLLLAILALTSFHVQIINRIASGYPAWYVVIAVGVVEGAPIQVLGRHFDLAKSIFMWMVMYAIVQAGLFASFLPPA